MELSVQGRPRDAMDDLRVLGDAVDVIALVVVSFPKLKLGPLSSIGIA